MTGEEKPAFERMEALVRRMAADWSHPLEGGTFTDIAKRIVGDLDRARDPDIAVAQRIASSHCGAKWSAVLNGIKMGRELAEPAPPTRGEAS